MAALDRLKLWLDPPGQTNVPLMFANGRVVEREIGSQAGVTGLRRQNGILYEEDLRELRGTRWDRVVREMTTNDTIVGAVLFAIESLISQVQWNVEPVSDLEAADVEAAEFVTECLFHDMSETWEDTLSSILSFLPWGWSYHELVYKRRADGRIGWYGWPIRAQDTRLEWQFDDNGQVTAMIQQAPPDYVIRTIPLEKALLFRTTAARGSPEGFSILRRSYRAWNAKRRIENIEGIGVERDLAGLPVARVPSSVDRSSTVYDSYKSLVSNVRRDEQEGIILPSDRDEQGNYEYDLTLLSTGGQRQFDTSKIIDRYKTDIAMSVLADFIMIGHTETGSWSLVSSRTELFSMALQRWAKTIAATINRKAIPDLLLLNGLQGKCSLLHEDIETPDLQSLGAYIDALAKAGMPLFPDPALEARLRGYAGLPPASEDVEA